MQKESVQEKSSKKKKRKNTLIGTFFRNGIRSNLDLTSIADNKASILISLNGFILTVAVTAASFAIHSTKMTYAFIAIILTSLGSIIFAVFAVKPRTKEQLVSKKELQDYESVLYYQDMADLPPKEYLQKTNEILKSTKKTQNELISHLHIIGSEIKKKYFWLKIAYTYFAAGLTISALIIIYALTYVEKTPFYNLKKGNIAYKNGQFYNIFEPSGVTMLNDSKILVVEDEGNVKAFKLLEFSDDKMVELGNLYIPKHLKKRVKKIEDIEALASKNEYVFAITSHSLSRKHKRKKSREKLLLFTYEEGSMQKFYEYTHLKEDLHKTYKNLFDNLLQIDDLNIEGLALDEKGKLYIGLRSPLAGFEAIVVVVSNPFEVMQKNAPIHFEKVFRLNLDGLGIRGMSYDKEKKGFWILGGSSAERGMSFKLFFWDRKNAPHFIRNQPDLGFAEGISVIRDSAHSFLFIVDDDGKKPNKSAHYILIDKESL